MSLAPAAAPPATPVPKTHPPGFYFIFWGEFAERCSYYGMRAILPLYMTGVLGFSDSKTSAIYSSFKAACYFLPLLGGFLADRYFGKYWTIVGFSIPYIVGQFALGLQTEPTLYIALLLLAGGSGVIKPNISTLMGMTYDQKRPGQERLRSAAFLWFYFSINVGAMISLFALPQLRDYLANTKYEVPLSTTSTVGLLGAPFGQGPLVTASSLVPQRPVYGPLPYAYRVAFQFPAWLMVAALAAFAFGKRSYAAEVIERHKLSPEERRQRLSVLTTLFGIFGLIIFFWVAYEQNDNLWTFFARDHIDRTLDFGFFRKEFAPDGFQFINALVIIVLVPLFNWLTQKIDAQGRRFKPTRKVFIGFLCTAAASGVMSLAGYLAVGGNKVSAWWIVLGFFVLTVGEILVYGTMLELSFTAAPANMKSFVTACFLVTNALGNMINTQVSPLYGEKIAPGPFFAMTAGIVLAASIAFYFVGRRFTRGASTTAPAPAPA